MLMAGASYAPTAGQTVSLYFLRDGTSYHAAVVDQSGKLLASASLASTSSIVLGKDPVSRAILMCPHETGSGYLVEVDDYAMYK
jgi:hypothetical protein